MYDVEYQSYTTKILRGHSQDHSIRNWLSAKTSSRGDIEASIDTKVKACAADSSASFIDVTAA
jgi:hypothetical protein